MTYKFWVKKWLSKNYLSNFKQKSPEDLNSGSAVHKTNALDQWTMMINNQLEFLFDHTLTSLRTAAVAQWVRAFASQADGWMFEWHVYCSLIYLNVDPFRRLPGLGDGGGYVCLSKMCDMLVFHMTKTLISDEWSIRRCFLSGNTYWNQKRISND